VASGSSQIGRRRLDDFYDFVVSQLPSPDARVLEVGCGGGQLARALARAGYSILAIDPKAPEGAIFRRTRLEDFTDRAGFEGVVASVSLHHVEDAAGAVSRIHDLLRPGGLLILEEFDRERLRGATARWYHGERLRLAIERDDEPPPGDWQVWLRRWQRDHADVHPFDELRRELDARFVERHFARTPYLYDHWLADELQPVERALIASGAIEATGVQYVGERRA
jgi:SAM-dependent methyltransferase